VEHFHEGEELGFGISPRRELTLRHPILGRFIQDVCVVGEGIATLSQWQSKFKKRGDEPIREEGFEASEREERRQEMGSYKGIMTIEIVDRNDFALKN
jgi:hypothetical protein